MLPRSPPESPRPVRCYHCRKHFDVPARAMSISCPWCSTRVALGDVIVKDTCWTGKVQTCGKVIVKRNAELVASLIEASAGVEIHGRVEVGRSAAAGTGGAGGILSRGLIWIGPHARVKGDLTAPSIHVEPGGAIDGGMVKIASDRLVPGPSRPPPKNPMGFSPILRPENPVSEALVRVLPFLRNVLQT